MPKPTMSERSVVELVARYLQLKHPKLIYRFDLAADLKLTIGQASRHKRLHPNRGYPDLFIAKSVGDKHGLFLEVKAPGIRLRKVKDGTWADKHVEEQAAMLANLNELGYVAKFTVGYEDCIQTIDAYLAGDTSIPVLVNVQGADDGRVF